LQLEIVKALARATVALWIGDPAKDLLAPPANLERLRKGVVEVKDLPVHIARDPVHDGVTATTLEVKDPDEKIVTVFHRCTEHTAVLSMVIAVKITVEHFLTEDLAPKMQYWRLRAGLFRQNAGLWPIAGRGKVADV